MKKSYLLALCSVIALSPIQAQNISFGKIQSPEQFSKYWGLDKTQVQKYEKYMQVAGKYRHTQVNPLVVLSMISDDAEDKEYFAQKAAKYESQMVQREIQSAWLITQAMEKQGLNTQLSQFSDKLTGLDTESYVPSAVKNTWEDGDELVIVIDDVCVQTNCLQQFVPLLKAVPDNVKINQLLVAKLPKDEKLQQAFNTMSQPLLGQFKLTVKRYDPIEFGYLEGLKNQMAQGKHSSNGSRLQHWTRSS